MPPFRVADAARVDEPVRVVDEPERHLEVEPIVPAVSEWQRRPHRRVDGPLVDRIHTMPSDILSLEKRPAARCRADASRSSLRLAGGAFMKKEEPAKPRGFLFYYT